MANQLGALGIDPRSKSRHQRHRIFARTPLGRVKHAADQFTSFLTTQATRLTTTPLAIFNFLKRNTAKRIASAANTGQLS